MSQLTVLAAIFALLLSALQVSAEPARLRFKPDGGDTTLLVQEALKAVQARDVVLEFEPGRYEFSPESALESYLTITNHNNGPKRIIFPMDRFDSVRIEGHGAEFIFHGRVLPFLFKDCRMVDISDLTIDWATPLYFQATVSAVNQADESIDLIPFVEGFSWALRDGQLQFPNLDGVFYRSLGETLAFDEKKRRVAHGAWDIHIGPSKVEELPNGHLRLQTELPHYPEVGRVLVAKGNIDENRYAPAIYGIQSSNITVQNVIIHHALGMGFLFERCEDITLSQCGAFVRPTSPRMVSLLADATHFCNCKGAILVENSRFQHMLDDGTNVHGTYVRVDEVLSAHQVRVELMHFQQRGFQFAEPGDEIWLISAPHPGRSATRTTTAFQILDEQFSVITFDTPIADNLRPGDLLENKTWNPSFTMRGCTISDHRARGIVLKTPLPVLIENNDISSMMSAIFFRGESAYWYESGSVQDVLIRNNRFHYCAYSGMEHAILRITPRLGEAFDPSIPFDRNIRFEGNEIRTFGNRMVWADRVEGLQITGNTFVQTTDAPLLHPQAALIELSHSPHTRIEGNFYSGKNRHPIFCDPVSRESLTLADNQGFHEAID